MMIQHILLKAHRTVLLIIVCNLLLAAPFLRAQEPLAGNADSTTVWNTKAVNPLDCQPADTLWNMGARHYRNGDFESAISAYKALENNNLASPSLYYNMGNAYFRTGDTKRAILYYERALRLDPQNDDIQYNLSLAGTYIADKMETVDELFLLTWLKRLGDKGTLNQWAVLSIAFFALMLLSAALFLLVRRTGAKYASFWMGWLFLLLTAGAFGGAYYQYGKISNNREAIVFSASVTAKSSPNDSGNNLFIIHEGLKVHIEDTVGTWCEIKLPDGSKGWVKQSDLEVI